VARCVGRSQASPLPPADVSALAAYLEAVRFAAGAVVFPGGQRQRGVWIVRSGTVELAVGSGRRRAIVQLLRAGDVDGDIQLVLGMPPPYTARAMVDSECLFIPAGSFERLLVEHPAISRRWLTSVAGRLASSQARLLGLLGRSLPEQVARLLLDESVDGLVPFAQRTLAAMLGVQRPSLNKVLKDFERDGVVELSYRTVRIVDRDVLERRGGPAMGR
jgi:CRP-like cAMP-binding protein